MRRSIEARVGEVIAVDMPPKGRELFAHIEVNPISDINWASHILWGT